MTSAELLTMDDRCRRSAYLGQRWELNALRPSEILRRAIQYGLESEAEDAGLAASDHAMKLCVERPIDAPETDLLSLAEHISSLANMLVYICRPGNDPWCRPEDVRVGKSLWESSAFLNSSGSSLRQLLVIDSWTEERQLGVMHSYQVRAEMAAYGLPMTLLVAIIGKRRDGRWVNPLTRGWQHPVSYDLRFLKRDGEPFGPTWTKTWREKYDGTREDWLEAMTSDGVLADSLIVHQIESIPHEQDIRKLIETQLLRVDQTQELPSPQLSVCDNPTAPCQFRSTCPYFRMPSLQRGFRSVSSLPTP